MKKFKYVIVSTRMPDGGVVVLHSLCKYLSELGEDVKMFYIGDRYYKKGRKVKFWINWLIFQMKVTIKNTAVRFLDEKAKSWYMNYPKHKYRRKFLPFVSKNTVVIYSEPDYGNPLHAKKQSDGLCISIDTIKKKMEKLSGIIKMIYFLLTERFSMMRNLILNVENCVHRILIWICIREQILVNARENAIF